MSNKLISNEMASALDLSVIKDIHGNPVTLRGRGGAGAVREVSAEAVEHEVVQRVLALQWISVKPVGVLAAEVKPVQAEVKAVEAAQVEVKPADVAPGETKVEAAEKAETSDAADVTKTEDSQPKRKR